MGELEKFFHASDELPPLIKIGLAHAQFETIHPFLDGNGRIGRLLITFFLCQQNILQKPVLYLSHYFKQYRSEYYEKLQRTRVSGDWEGWLKFFLRGVADVGRQATDTAREIVDLRENHRHIIMNEFGGTAANANKLLEYLYSHPTVSVNGVKEVLQVSFPNANSLVEKFCKNQILFEITGQARNRVFSYSPYINLFANL